MTLKIGDAEVRMYDLVEEARRYFLDCIEGARIDYIKYSRRGKLQVKIDSEPIIEIIVDPDTIVSSGEIWQFNGRESTIIF